MSFNLKDKIGKLLEIPQDVIKDVPKITILGDIIFVENYKNIILYEKENIQITTSIGTLKIDGKNFKIREITTDDILISGTFFNLEIEKNK